MISSALRRELNKLRELVHFVLDGAGATPREENGPFLCWFCREVLNDVAFTEHGNATGPKFEERISIHHVDGDHANNERMNKALSHTKCHKGFHRRIGNELREARKRGEIK